MKYTKQFYSHTPYVVLQRRLVRANHKANSLRSSLDSGTKELRMVRDAADVDGRRLKNYKKQYLDDQDTISTLDETIARLREEASAADEKDSRARRDYRTVYNDLQRATGKMELIAELDKKAELREATLTAKLEATTCATEAIRAAHSKLEAEFNDVLSRAIKDRQAVRVLVNRCQLLQTAAGGGVIGPDALPPLD